MANVSAKHPDWQDRRDEWAQMRHAHRGDRAVKAEGEAYLPMPSGFRAQADDGKSMYRAYQTRAQFPDVLAPTLRGMVGVIHRTEAQIEMPAALEPIWERATRDGLTLEALHRRITGELLLMGRFGLLVDAPSEGGDLPYLAGYSPEALINWSPERDFFVLDESGLERNGFEWRDRKQYRVLEMRDGTYTVRVYEGETEGEEIIPQARGGGALDEIPFVVIGSRDLDVKPDEPPLIGVARPAYAWYRLDADYRHQLFMSGQETLVIINGEAPSAVGAGVVLTLQGDQGVTPDAKYVGPAGTGIDAHRTAIQDEREAAIAGGAKLFEQESRSQESGEAKRLRYTAQTATLTSIAQASAAGLEKALRYAARMVGADPKQVVVTPSLKFLDSAMSPQDVQHLVTAWQNRAISYETLYENLQRGEIASAERDHEAEMRLIDEEFFVEPTEAGVMPGLPESARAQ